MNAGSAQVLPQRAELLFVAPSFLALDRRALILLVDDERAVRAALRLAFEDSEQFSILTAASAEEALSLDELRSVQLVIADKNLPAMSGLDLIHRLRGRGLQMPTILITGYANQVSRADSMALGVVAYLEKPFRDIYEVPRLVADILGRRERSVV